MNICVTVKAGSKKGPMVEYGPNDTLIVYVREPAVENRANHAVIELLSKYYGVPKSKISIKQGFGSRHKIIVIDK